MYIYTLQEKHINNYTQIHENVKGINLIDVLKGLGFKNIELKKIDKNTYYFYKVYFQQGFCKYIEIKILKARKL